MFPLPAPMLATRGRPNAGLDDWTVEVKLDGWRTIVGVSSEGYQVRTRRGRSIGDRLPELGRSPPSESTPCSTAS